MVPQRGCTDKCIMVLMDCNLITVEAIHNNRKWVQDNWLLVRIPYSITGLGSRLIGSAGVCPGGSSIYYRTGGTLIAVSLSRK